MEEIKKMAAQFAVEFERKHKIMEKNPLLAFGVVTVYSDGFEYGYTFSGTKDDAKVPKAATDYVENKDATIRKESPMLFILLTLAYMEGANKAFEVREKVDFQRDENGNIIGLTL